LARIPRLDEIDPIELLVRQKFPNLAALRAASINVRGNISTARVREVEAEANRYREELKDLSDEEIEERVQQAKDVFKKLFEEDLSLEKPELQEADFWFNAPGTRPDYHRWAMLPYWTLEEAIMLSLDRDPKKVQVKSVLSFLNASNLSSQVSHRLEFATRAKALKKFFDPVLPPFFVRWAQTYGVILPIELIDSVEAAHGVHRNWEDEAKRLSGVITELREKLETALAENSSLKADLESKPEGLGERERTSMLKLIAGMAAGRYGCDPKALRNPATRAIADDLQLNGIPLDEDTVRKYLQLAKAILEEYETE
jgi:hypothetical protein